MDYDMVNAVSEEQGGTTPCRRSHRHGLRVSINGNPKGSRGMLTEVTTLNPKVTRQTVGYLTVRTTRMLT